MNTSHLRLRVFWGDILYDTRVLQARESVTVGAEDSNDYVFAIHPTLTRWNLAKSKIDEVAIRLLPQQEGFFHDAQESIPFRQLPGRRTLKPLRNGGQELTLLPGERAELRFEDCTFAFDWVERGSPLPKALPVTWPTLTKSSLVGSLLFGLSLWVNTLPPPSEIKVSDRVVTLVSADRTTPPPIVPEKIEEKVETKPEPLPVPEPPAPPAVTQKASPSKRAAPPPRRIEPANPAPPASLAPANEDWDEVGGSLSQLSRSSAPRPTAPVARGGEDGLAVGALPGIAQEQKTGATVGQGEGKLGRAARTDGGTGKGAQNGEPGLAREVIESFVRGRDRRLQSCYEKELAHLQNRSGYLKVKFTINAAGAVTRLKVVDDTLRSTAVSQCVQTEVAGWIFPTPQNGTPVHVEYPFVFEPR